MGTRKHTSAEHCRAQPAHARDAIDHRLQRHAADRLTRPPGRPAPLTPRRQLAGFLRGLDQLWEEVIDAGAGKFRRLLQRSLGVIRAAEAFALLALNFRATLRVHIGKDDRTIPASAHIFDGGKRKGTVTYFEGYNFHH